LTPTLPVVPEVTLPPRPITPELPGGVVPPIGTLPEKPIEPELPGVVTLPGGRQRMVSVVEDLPPEVIPKGWNVWSDLRFSATSDTRNGLDLECSGTYWTLGSDTAISDRFLMGATFSLEENTMEAFSGSWRVNTDGFSVGPYFNYQLSEHWSLDASVGINQSDHEGQIDILRGSYSSQRLFGALGLSAQYSFGRTMLRPSLGYYYGHTRNSEYDLRGTLNEIDLVLPVEADSFNAGSLSTGLEVSHLFRAEKGTMIVPYADLSAVFMINQLVDGENLTDEPVPERDSPWTESLRVGVRFLYTSGATLEVSTGYLGFGHRDLNVWEQRIFVSYAF